MHVLDAIEQLREHAPGPVYVLVGEETFLIERAVGLARAGAVGAGGMRGFDDDVFQGQGLSAGAVIQTAGTLPMLAERRFVLVRHLDAAPLAEQTALAAYVADPNPSTCLVCTASKLDGRGALPKAAKKARALFDAKPLRAREVHAFARSEAKARGNPMSPDAADALVEALGEDLSAVDDAIERLSLYVGAGQRIDATAVAACVTHVRPATIWALVDAIGLMDDARALRAARSLLADREPPLRILAMVARQLRMVARMREALASGLPEGDAAKAAGAPPFKARELKASARRFTLPALEQAFETLGATDLALKGSKRPPEVVLEEALMRLCRP